MGAAMPARAKLKRRRWGEARFKQQGAQYTFARGQPAERPAGRGEQDAQIEKGAEQQELWQQPELWRQAAGGGKKGGRAKRAAVQPSVTQIRANVSELAAAAYAKSTHRAIRAAMGAMEDFHACVRDERPVLFLAPSFAGDLHASLHNEMSLMMFGAWMVMNGLAASTTITYLSLCKTNLGMQFGWCLTCKEAEMRLPKMLKGIRKMHKRVRKKRLGWRARLERELEGVLGEPEGEEAWTQAALRRALRQGLLRGADVLPERAADFDAERHAQVRDIELVEQSKETPRHFRLLVQPAKKTEQNGKTEYVYFPEGDGTTDAFTAIKHMMEARPRASGEEPLFMTNKKGESWTVGGARALLRHSARALGLEENLFGAHSGRIGGATDLFASGCDGVMLQIQGRW